MVAIVVGAKPSRTKTVVAASTRAARVCSCRAYSHARRPERSLGGLSSSSFCSELDGLGGIGAFLPLRVGPVPLVKLAGDSGAEQPHSVERLRPQDRHWR